MWLLDKTGQYERCRPRSILRTVALKVVRQPGGRSWIRSGWRWGRHDLATSLQIAEAASARYGWPLHRDRGLRRRPAHGTARGVSRALRAPLEP